MLSKFLSKSLIIFFTITLLVAAGDDCSNAYWGGGYPYGLSGMGYSDYGWGASPFFMSSPYFMPSPYAMSNPLMPGFSPALTQIAQTLEEPGPDYTGVPSKVRKIKAMGSFLFAIYERNGFDIWEDAPVAETGLAVFNMADLKNPTLIGQIKLTLTQDDEKSEPARPDEIIINEDLAFIYQQYPAVVWIIDLSRPTDPKILNSLTLEDGVMTHLLADEEQVYLVLNGLDGKDNGIHVLDLTNPDELEIIAFLPLKGKAGALWLESGYLYVFGQDSGKGCIFDLWSDTPTTPSGEIEIAGESVMRQGNFLYLVTGYADVESRLHVFSLANPAQPELKESVNLTGREKQVMQLGEYIQVWKSSVFDSIHYVETLHPATIQDSPKAISTLRLSDQPWGLTCGDNYLYILGESGLRVLDFSDPNEPSLEEAIDLSSYLENYESEQIDPILESPPADEMDIEEGSPMSWIFPPNSWFGSTYPGGGFSSWDFPITKGYGSVASAGPGPYGFSNSFGSPWFGCGLSSAKSSSNSYAPIDFDSLFSAFSDSFSCDYSLMFSPFSQFFNPDDVTMPSLFLPHSISFY